MFEQRYYQNKYIHIDINGTLNLYEANITSDGVEFFMYSKTDNGYNIYLKDTKHFLHLNGSVVSLKDFLINNGYTPTSFINPLGRTKKILNEINKINELNKPKIKKK